MMKVLAILVAAAAATSAQASVEISSKPTHNMNCTGGVCTPTAKNADLNATDLANMLATSDIKVVTGAGAVTITVSQSFSWTSSHRLTLDANLNVSFRAPVVVAGQGGVTIITNDGGSGGDLLFFPGASLDFWDNSSSLIINGNAYTLAKSINGIKRGGSFVALAKSFDAGKRIYIKTPVSSFSGTLEGLGNTISNLTVISGHGKGPVGLIGYAGGTNSPVTIRDIGLISVDIEGAGFYQVVGALVGRLAYGTITNSYVAGQVSASGGGAVIGGLAGFNLFGAVTHSFSSAAVSGRGNDTAYIGGLVGLNGGDCQAGPCVGSIDQSYSTGIVTSASGYRGGLVGANAGGSIFNSYATGAVTATNGCCVPGGGLVGENFNNPPYQADPIITDSYSIGAVTGDPDGGIGGLIGTDFADPGITDAYWDMDTSDVNDPARGAGYPLNDPGITGLTDVQLKAGLPSGFDPAIWGQSASVNNGYPYLLANPPPQ